MSPEITRTLSANKIISKWMKQKDEMSTECHCGRQQKNKEPVDELQVTYSSHLM